jgi:DNA polymerase I-like protein with 3'-5' exonuclease and polymerase domains
MYEAGYTPSITMHDEAGANVTSARECREIGEIMSNAVRLVVPVTVDLEVGKTWGKAKTPYEKVFG